MSEIMYNCKNHGELTLEKVRQNIESGRTRYRCRECLHEYETKKRKRPDNHYEKYIKVKSREWRRANSNLVNERVANRRKQDPEKFREYDRKWRRENINLARYKDVLKKHKITMEEYLVMIDSHNNRCRICNSLETRKSRTEGNICKLAIDHCHICEDNDIKGMLAIRGLLCHDCNTGLGKFKDNPIFLRIAAQYAEDHANKYHKIETHKHTSEV